jgi:hypothetical protein
MQELSFVGGSKVADNGWRYGYVSPTTSLSNYNKTLKGLLTIPLVTCWAD